MKTLVLSLFVAAVSPAPAQDLNLIVNGSFEAPLLPPGAVYVVGTSDLAPWQTDQNAFAIFAPNLASEAADGKQHIEVVTLWQTVSTVPGQDYRLKLYHAARPAVDSLLSVSINGEVVRIFEERGSVVNSFNWQPFGTNFTATSNTTTIRFDGVGVGGNAHVDNVSLELLPVRAEIRVLQVSVCWQSVIGKLYQPQYLPSPTTTTWLNIGSPLAGNGEVRCLTNDVPSGEPQRLYRVMTFP